MSSDSLYLYSASSDSTIRRWEISTGQCVAVFPHPHGVWVWSLCQSSNDEFIFSGSYGKDDTIRQWNVSDGSVGSFESGHTGGISGLCMSRGGELIYSCSWDKTIREWRISSGHLNRTFPIQHTDAINSICLSCDDEYLFSGSDDKTVVQWLISSGTCIRVFTAHTGSVKSVCMSNDGRSFVYSGSGEGPFVSGW